LFFPHESILLHAFLVQNARYELKVALSMLHYARSCELQHFLPNYRPAHDDDGLAFSDGHFLSSAYLRVMH